MRIAYVGVLIETYWNVNESSAIYWVAGALVLIETYWNVNTNFARSKNSSCKY